MGLYEQKPILSKDLVKRNIKEILYLLAIVSAVVAFGWHFYRDKILPEMVRHHKDRTEDIISQKNKIR